MSLFSAIVVVAARASPGAADALERGRQLAALHALPLETVAAEGAAADAAAGRCEAGTLVVVDAGGGASLTRCSGALLVVKRPVAGPYRNVLAALDLEPGSEQVLAAAHALAPQARVTAAHAYDVPFEGALHRSGVGAGDIDRHRGEALREALARIEQVATRVAGPAHEVLPMSARGHPVPFLLEAAASTNADLVAVARRRRGAVERFWLGSVAKAVLADAPCDVLVAPELER